MKKGIMALVLMLLLTAGMEVKASPYSASAPGTEGAAVTDVKPAGKGEFFWELDTVDYSIGKTVDGTVFDSDYDSWLFRLTSPKKVTMEWNGKIDNPYLEDDEEEDLSLDVMIRLHKVQYDGEDTYTCVGCISEGSVWIEDESSYSKTWILDAGYYIIEVDNEGGTGVDYTFRTKDVTEYATSVSIPSKLYVAAGKQEKIKTSNVLPAGAVADLSWTSSDKKIAAVDQNGNVKGVSYGSCTITVTLKNAKKSYTCKVYVDDPVFGSKNIKLLKGQRKTVKVKNTYQKVSYVSSNPSIASIGKNDGKIVAKKKGKVTITATAGSKKFKCSVQVEDPKLNVTKKSMVAGDTLQLKLTGTTQKIKWSTSTGSKAAVSSKGMVTAKKNGTVKIRAKVSDKTYTCTITVKETKLKDTKVKMSVGAQKKLEWKSKVKNVKWSSENKNIATVNSKGVVTAKKAGKTKIYAKVGDIRYICTVTCEKPKLSKNTLTLQRTKSVSLKVTGTTMKVRWKSSNSSVAAVNSRGRVTGKKAGTATIIATVGGKDLKCKVTVKGLYPKMKIRMSSQPIFDTSLCLVAVKNEGKSAVRIYSEGAQHIGYVSSYNRNLKLIDYNKAYNEGAVQYIDYIDIQPGQEAYVLFEVQGASIYYCSMSKIQYRFRYDGTDYTESDSYYYGCYYSYR